jgi:hypothetical protein
VSSTAGLLLALTPLLHESSPAAMGLGNELVLQSDAACAAFCLKSLNSQFDVQFSAHASMAESPQQGVVPSEGFILSPTQFKTYEASWHPFYEAAVTLGYRNSERQTERLVGGKTVRRVTATKREIPIAVSLKPNSQLALAAGYNFKKTEISQDSSRFNTNSNQTMTASPSQWSFVAIWQKDDVTGIGLSYKSAVLAEMTPSSDTESTINAASRKFVNPRWTEPQEITVSLARLTSLKPPDGIVVGPFENVFHGSISVVSWESGRPVTYSILAAPAVANDGWSLTEGPSAASDEFAFNTLDPNISLSAGLESLWYRNRFGSVTTLTHIRINHIATRAEQNQLQGGFGFSINTKHFGMQAASLWRNSQSGFSVGVSSFL